MGPDPFMDLEGLGHHIVSRRVTLGCRTRTDFANSLKITARTLSDIEHGVRKASAGTYALLENKLAWAPSSVDTILAERHISAATGRDDNSADPVCRRLATGVVPADLTT
jgi:hypothetical protein